MSARDWSESEVRSTVEEYFDMLVSELRGEAYSKASHRQSLLPRLNGRTSGSVEFKFGNISAVLRDLGFTWVDGYKPYSNYQALLVQAVTERIAADKALQRLATGVAGKLPLVTKVLPLADPAREVECPERPRVEDKRGSGLLHSSTLRFDFAKRDAENRRLGELGERFVLEVERARLSRAGRPDLADRVEWTSRDVGDGTGYDITSFTASEDVRLLEVKTTNHHKRFPFVVSRNEVVVSEEKHNAFSVVRVFDFGRDPRFFLLPGAISKSCRLEPRSYTARL